MSDTQRVYWNLPTEMVEKVKAHMEARGFATQSEAAADLFGNGGQSAESTVTATGPAALADERHGVPQFVDPHEAYPFTPAVPTGEVVETIGTDGAGIARGVTGEIGNDEDVDTHGNDDPEANSAENPKDDDKS